MRLRSRNAIALAIAVLVLIGAGVALAQSQSPSQSTSSKQGKSRVLGRSAFLDDVARRLGIQRSTLDAALKAIALADVKWAEDNDFITKTQADLIRERINSGEVRGLGRFGLHGPLGFGLGGFGRHGGWFKGHVGRGFALLSAASNYLGLSEGNLLDALRSKTLARIAREEGKSIDGLEAALRVTRKAALDEAVAGGEITEAQENALLTRFDSQVRDVVNGIPPALIDRVDAALAQGIFTKAQADAITQRIRSSPAWPLGDGFGLCGDSSRFGFRFGHGQPGVPFDHSGYSEDVVGV
jgi:hypothetical protein